MNKTADSSVTVQNIEAAFAGESMAHISNICILPGYAAPTATSTTPGSSKILPPRKCSMPSATWICSIFGKRSTR
jgi:hypothetical protein